MSRFFWQFCELEKIHSMRSAQRQVELRRLSNHLPVLGKANSLCKIVKMLCVLPLRLSLGRVGPGITIFRVTVSWDLGKICLASRRCTTVPVAPPGGVKNTNSRFFVRSVPLFCSLMLTPMIVCLMIFIAMTSLHVVDPPISIC